MEMTLEQWRLIKKDLRRRFSVNGWILLLYYGIMNVAVFFAVYADMIINMIMALSSGDLDAMAEAAEGIASNAWGYFLSIGVGLVILLIWKKPRYFKDEIWARGKPMTPSSFFSIMCIFLGGQTVYQIVAVILELILNSFGLSIMDGMAEMSVDTDSFSMFLYAGILAPVSEEILFRGLIQRNLMPYGKRFAIFCSAFTFGVFHGNLLQSGFAFLVGLVLGYVASEYSIAWAMLLHMINNLVIADMLTRLTSPLPEVAAGLILWAILLAAAVAGLVILIVKRKEIREYRHRERMNGTYLRCFFSSPGMVIFMVIMGLNMAASLLLMVRTI